MFKPELIAPCGMNCGICMAYLRNSNKCFGCRVYNINMPITRVRCKIKTCEYFQNSKTEFCFECNSFPCKNLRHLDKRYQTKYQMSMIDNLNEIKQGGVDAFLEKQREKYKCPGCGGVISVHNRKCYDCEKIESWRDK
jgi:hypothetical protein